MEHIKESCQTIISSYQTMFEQFQSISSENVRLKNENQKLLENEKDLMSVSSIVATKNENASLLNKISLLEKSNTTLRTNIKELQNVMKNSYSTNSLTIKENINNQRISSNLINDNVQQTFEERINNEINSDEDVEEELYTIIYKKKSYYMDTNNNLFSIGNDGEKQDNVGKRIFDKKKAKYKYILN
jgi:hydroxylamine reductase (hybrid-cluster protein)|tara:strand:- start:5489 stop:6049 length:561 start_codon:yes stop_codon:yes gene_type:complete